MKSIRTIIALIAVFCGFSKSQTNADTLPFIIHRSLDSAFSAPEKVYRLEITHQHLNTDTLDLSSFKNLEYLSLSYDSLTNLPKGLKNLQNLKVLDISANNFKVLPEELALIPNLEELYLNKQGQLDISKSFSVINRMRHLKKLHLDSMGKLELPKHFKPNSSIEYISMRYDSLQDVPSELYKFKKLKTLDLGGNDIVFINNSFKRNKSLETLSLSVSPSIDLNRFFTVLSKTRNLNALAIYNSSLVGLPEDMSYLKNITSISLINDHIKTFPLGLTTLSNLKKLDMSGNEISTLPANFKNFKKIEELDLSNNFNLNFLEASNTLRLLPSLNVVHIQNYDFTFNSQSYLSLLKNKNYMEIKKFSDPNNTIHLFKNLKNAGIPQTSSPFNNYQIEGFGIRFGW